LLLSAITSKTSAFFIGPDAGGFWSKNKRDEIVEIFDRRFGVVARESARFIGPKKGKMVEEVVLMVVGTTAVKKSTISIFGSGHV
jgi:hypothetical protein